MRFFFKQSKASTDGINAKWRKVQLKNLRLIIRMAFADDAGKNKKLRMIKCYKIFRKKFWNLGAYEWIPYMAGMFDWQLLEGAKEFQVQKDLYMVRNKAIYACHLWNLNPIL